VAEFLRRLFSDSCIGNASRFGELSSGNLLGLAQFGQNLDNSPNGEVAELFVLTIDAGDEEFVAGPKTLSNFMTQAFVPLLVVATLIVVLAVAIYLVRMWLRDNDGPAASPYDLLAEYRELHRKGELSDEEFRIIKGRLATRISGAPVPKPLEDENQKE
jgi:hypothetical protein